MCAVALLTDESRGVDIITICDVYCYTAYTYTHKFYYFPVVPLRADVVDHARGKYLRDRRAEINLLGNDTHHRPTDTRPSRWATLTTNRGIYPIYTRSVAVHVPRSRPSISCVYNARYTRTIKIITDRIICGSYGGRGSVEKQLSLTSDR